MTIAKIVVPVTGSKRDEAALATAFLAAKLFGAHVEALFVHRDPREAIGYSELTLRPEIVQNLVDTAELLAKEAGQAASRTFAVVAARAEIKVAETPQNPGWATASYREVTGHLSRVLATEGALSDLVVFPPIAHKDEAEVHDAFVRVLAGIGRPVLLAPENPPEHIGRRIVVGWDGRGAAANALLSALPFLDKASAVEILSVQHRPAKAAASMTRGTIWLFTASAAASVSSSPEIARSPTPCWMPPKAAIAICSWSAVTATTAWRSRSSAA